MKKIILIVFVLLLFIVGDSVFAVEGFVGEGDTTASFSSKLLGLFSGEFLLKIITSIIALFITFILSKVISSKLSGYLERANLGENSGREELIGVIIRTVNIVILITGFSISLGLLGVDLAIFMGGIGFGIGFTLKTFLTNFISGILMVTQGVHHNGDLIQVGDRKGQIIRINALFTEVEQLDGVMFYIPNIKFLEEEVRNFNTNNKRRVEVEIVVDYDSDLQKIKQIINQVFGNFPNILKAPSTALNIDSLGKDGVVIKSRFWISGEENYVDFKSNVTETINMAFKKYGIKISPQRIEIEKVEK